MLTQILAPAAILVMWTLIMMFWMAATRLPAITQKGQEDLRINQPGGRGQHLEGVIDDKINWKAHNYVHLMEQPTIFYAAVFILAMTGAASGDVMAAWIYVGLRIVHSLYQATVNVPRVRFVIFLLASFALIYLSFRAIMATLFAEPSIVI